MDLKSTDKPVVIPRKGRPKKQLTTEKRVRRDIANENEKRRMEYINSGFQSLRQLLKRRSDANKSDQKQTKATVLSESAKYIQLLEQQISLITNENQLMKKCLNTNQNFIFDESLTKTASTVPNDCTQDSEIRQSEDPVANDCVQQNMCDKNEDFQDFKCQLILRERLEESLKSLNNKVLINAGNECEVLSNCSTSDLRPEPTSNPTLMSSEKELCVEEKPLDLSKKYCANSLTTNTQKTYSNSQTNEYKTLHQSMILTNARSSTSPAIKKHQNIYNTSKPSKLYEYLLSKTTRMKHLDTKLKYNTNGLPVYISFAKDNKTVSTTNPEANGQLCSKDYKLKRNLELMLKTIQHLEGSPNTDMDNNEKFDCVKHKIKL